MTSDLELPGKWTLRCGGRRVVVVKKPGESSRHVVMKALLWGLYLPDYPDLAVEVRVPGRYRPDVISTQGGEHRFWGEAGQVSLQKIRTLLTRHPATHFAFGRWASPLRAWDELLRTSLEGTRRHAPVDLVAFPEDSAERFLDERGNVRITHADLDWRRY